MEQVKGTHVLQVKDQPTRDSVRVASSEHLAALTTQFHPNSLIYHPNPLYKIWQTLTLHIELMKMIEGKMKRKEEKEGQERRMKKCRTSMGIHKQGQPH